MFSRKGVPFAVKSLLFNFLISRPPKREKVGKFLDLENFRSILPLTLEVTERTSFYSSSEPNDSDIVNSQTGGEKLKYVLRFYIGVHVT